MGAGRERRWLRRQRPEAQRHISSCISWGVRPIEMLGAPRSRITTVSVPSSGAKYHQRRSGIVPRRDRVDGTLGTLSRPCGCPSSSSGPSATTLPTPRSTATASSSGRATSAGWRAASTPGCRSATGSCARSSRSCGRRWTAPARRSCALPIVQPLELWERSGRDQTYGPLMFQLEDRKETAFCLSPTAEEVVTTTVAGEYSSYRDLPVNLYQINWKYRDELRPRFGAAAQPRVPHEGRVLVRPRRRGAAGRVPTRCSTRTAASSTAAGSRSGRSKAQSGEIGGDMSQEFMAVAAVGEDDFVWCEHCDYAANVEAATRAAPRRRVSGDDVPALDPRAHARHARHRRCRRAARCRTR